MRFTNFRIERVHDKDVHKFISINLKKTTRKAIHFNFHCGKISPPPPLQFVMHLFRPIHLVRNIQIV